MNSNLIFDMLPYRPYVVLAKYSNTAAADSWSRALLSGTPKGAGWDEVSVAVKAKVPRG